MWDDDAEGIDGNYMDDGCAPVRTTRTYAWGTSYRGKDES